MPPLVSVCVWLWPPPFLLLALQLIVTIIISLYVHKAHDSFYAFRPLWISMLE